MTDKKQAVVVLDADPAEALIEKIARAICGPGADDVTYQQIEPGVYEPYGPRWAHFTDQALAVFKALRDIGEPINTGDIEVVGYAVRPEIKSGKSFIVWPHPIAQIDEWNVPLVRHGDAIVYNAAFKSSVPWLEKKLDEERMKNGRLTAERDRIANDASSAMAEMVDIAIAHIGTDEDMMVAEMREVSGGFIRNAGQKA